MQNIEEQALATYTRTRPLLLRYADDTLTAVHKDEIDDFHEHLNRWSCSLRLLVSYSDYQVLVHKVNYWSDEVSDWEKLESDVYIAAQIRAASVNPSMVLLWEMVKPIMVMRTSNCQMLKNTRYIPGDWVAAQPR